MSLSQDCDRWLPNYGWKTAHSRVVDAETQVCAQALRDVTPGQMRTLRPLVLIRSLPSRLLSVGTDRGHAADTNQPVADWLVEGVGAFVLGGTEQAALIIGFAGRPWGLRQEWMTLTQEEFISFDEADAIKGLLAFRADPATGANAEIGRTELSTETRVCANDAGAARKFSWYWRVVGPFSSLIRRDWLSAAASAAGQRAN